MKSRNEHFIFLNHFEYFKTIEFKNRLGETRIGDSLTFKENATFQIIGICESIGPLLNHGNSGAENGFNSFIQQFTNTQVYDNFNIDNLSLLGAIVHAHRDFEISQDLINELDEFVLEILVKKLKQNHIPIVIGGGHNNALPLIRWAKITHSELAVVNVDPHADTRNTLERHSGNSFSIAIDEKSISRYFVLGLHEAYNNSFIRQYLKDHDVFHTFFEEYLFKTRNYIEDIESISTSIQNMHCGIELDMDSISNFPSSAISPSGWNLNELRHILYLLSIKTSKVAYLHLPEAAPKTDEQFKLCGKSLSYLVRDFIINRKI